MNAWVQVLLTCIRKYQAIVFIQFFLSQNNILFWTIHYNYHKLSAINHIREWLHIRRDLLPTPASKLLASCSNIAYQTGHIKTEQCPVVPIYHKLYAYSFYSRVLLGFDTGEFDSHLISFPHWHWANHRIVPMSVKTFRGHDDVIKWKHFPCYWPFVRRIHR